MMLNNNMNNSDNNANNNDQNHSFQFTNNIQSNTSLLTPNNIFSSSLANQSSQSMLSPKLEYSNLQIKANFDTSDISNILNNIIKSSNEQLNRLDGLERSISEKNSKISILDEKLNISNNEKKILQDQVNSLQCQLDNIIIKVEESSKIERNFKSSIDKIDTLSTLAKIKSEETNDGLHKLLERINKMEPHFDNTIKELAYSIEGTESRTKSMHSTVMSLKRDTNSLQEEINVILGRVEKLNTLANQNSTTEKNIFEKEINSKISNLERQVPELKHQLSDLKLICESFEKNTDRTVNEEIKRNINKNQNQLQVVQDQVTRFEKFIDSIHTNIANKADKETLDSLRISVGALRNQIDGRASGIAVDQTVEVSQKLSFDFGSLANRIRELESKQEQIQQHSADLESMINHMLHDVDELQTLQSNKPFVVDKRQHMPGVEELMEYISEENFNLRRELLQEIESSLKIMSNGNANFSSPTAAQRLTLRCLSCDQSVNPGRPSTTLGLDRQNNHSIPSQYPAIKYSSKFLNLKKHNVTPFDNDKTPDQNKQYKSPSLGSSVSYTSIQHNYAQPLRPSSAINSKKKSISASPRPNAFSSRPASARPLHSSVSNILNSSHPITAALKPYSSFLPKDSNLNNGLKESNSNELSSEIKITNENITENDSFEALDEEDVEEEDNDENISEELESSSAQDTIDENSNIQDGDIKNKHLTFKLPKDIEEKNISKSMDMGLHKSGNRAFRTRPQTAAIAGKTIDAPLPIRKPKSLIKNN